MPNLLSYHVVVFACQIAIQSVASARESRLSKKGRRGSDHGSARYVHVAPICLSKLPCGNIRA